MLIRSLAVAGALAGLVALAPDSVRAHGSLTVTSPPSGAIVTHLPKTIRVTFNEPIGKIIAATVTDATGRSHLLGVRRNPKYRAQILIATTGDRVSRYTVRWKVLAADGHAQQGVFRFRVSR